MVEIAYYRNKILHVKYISWNIVPTWDGQACIKGGTGRGDASSRLQNDYIADFTIICIDS